MYNINCLYVLPSPYASTVSSYAHKTLYISYPLKHTHTQIQSKPNFKNSQNSKTKQNNLVNSFWADMPSVSPLKKIDFLLSSHYQFSNFLVRDGILCSLPLLLASVLSDLNLCKSRVDCHILSEFIHALALLCLKKVCFKCLSNTVYYNQSAFPLWFFKPWGKAYDIDIPFIAG